jgi:BASS family bile acid:Na+ symporter
LTFASLIPLLLKASITLSVLAIGLKATPPDLIYLLRRPRELFPVLLSMNVVMPVVAVALCLIFDLNPAVKIALVALSVSPVPPILPKKEIKAGGTEEYSIGLLVAAALLSIFFVPATVEVFHVISGIPMQMSASQIAMLVLPSVLAPLLFGIGIRYLLPSFGDRAAKPISLIGSLVLVICVLPILFTAIRSILALVGDGTLIALALFAIIGLITGHVLGGPNPNNRPVLALATATRHPAVALAIGHTNFPGQKLAGALVLVYMVLSTLVAMPYLSWIRRRRNSVATEKQVA